MVFSLAAFFIAGLAAHNVFASPVPPPDCAPNTCPVDIAPHGAIPGNPLPPRDASPCPLEGDCGPLTVGPIILSPTSTSTVSPPSPTCTVHDGPVPIGEECFTSGPHAGQCISFECLESPNTCGCPGAPPPAPTKEKRSLATSSDCELAICTPITMDPDPIILVTTSTSAVTPVTPPSPTCTDHHGAIPIGEECFSSGPHAGQCISILCLEHPDTCGCSGTDVGKRRESEAIGTVCFENGTCTTLECLADPDSPTCLPQKEKRSEALPVPIGSICFENGTCTTFECLDHPESPGCATEKEKRREREHVKRDDSASLLHGGPGPVCVQPVCESCPDLPECTSDAKQTP
ncbi:MAG: hypothetical protein ALECFALPRED_009211 [Alectoria fallacina]|uniref:Uncharacterized protein n=1 Tax=Alectoria fallacina TaxID=1903189 RepID=A0A8H3F136_9LECA|nr:MAG: hypothetical protein ALECFALPRED_009211 [Alectoria fallacina]